VDPERGIIRADVDVDEQPRGASPAEDSRVVDLRVVRDGDHGPIDVALDADREIRLDEPPAHKARAAAGQRATARSLYRAIGLILAGSDVLCLAGAIQLAPALTIGRTELALPMVVAVCFMWVAVFHGFRLYSPQHLSSAEMFRRVISATSVGTFLLFVITLGSNPTTSRSWMGLTWALALLFELASRRCWNWWLFRMKTSRRLAYRTLIVGANEEARRLATVLEEASFGFQPIGHITLPGVISGRSSPSVMGTLDELSEVIDRTAADCVFVASSAVTLEQMSLVHRVVRKTGVELRVSANLPEILSTRLSVKPLGEVMTISLRPVSLTGSQAILKRTFDLLLASIGLLIASPVLGIVALLIKLSSPGPVIFRQERITKGGRVFTMYKFRTMAADADRILAEQDLDKSEAFFKVSDDAAITPVGRVLRRLSLDELPQLWNIMRGDMSIVGPRPLPAEQVAAHLELLEPRHEVRAGLTGWWQINGRSDVDPMDAVRMDLFYIENWSLTLDLYIVLKTFGALLAGKGAY
jgi:exopolysaccharide biosynthesis polyprenyl glycosylphosphotransferase